MNDDLYLNDGETYTNGVYYPEVPEDQKEDEAKHKGVIASSYPIMEDVANWFKEVIDDTKDMRNIDMQKTEINGVAVSLNVSIEAQVFGYMIANQVLSDKAAEFAEFGEGRS